MDVSKDEKSVDTPASETTDSKTEQEVNTQEDFSDVFKEETPKDDKFEGKVDGLNSYFSTLEGEDVAEKFFEQDKETRDSLRIKFPNKYGEFKEQVETSETDVIDKVYSKIQKKEELKQAQQAVNSFIEENPDLIKSHGSKLKKLLTEAGKKKYEPADRLVYALGKLSLDGIYVPTKAIKEAEAKAKQLAGQKISTSSSGEHKEKKSTGRKILKSGGDPSTW